MGKPYEGGVSPKGRRAQARMISFVVAFTVAHGYPPTVREMRDGLGYSSTSSVQHHIRKLREQEMIEYTPGSNRTIRVL